MDVGRGESSQAFPFTQAETNGTSPFFGCISLESERFHLLIVHKAVGNEAGGQRHCRIFWLILFGRFEEERSLPRTWNETRESTCRRTFCLAPPHCGEALSKRPSSPTRLCAALPPPVREHILPQPVERRLGPGLCPQTSSPLSERRTSQPV